MRLDVIGPFEAQAAFGNDEQLRPQRSFSPLLNLSLAYKPELFYSFE